MNYKKFNLLIINGLLISILFPSIATGSNDMKNYEKIKLKAYTEIRNATDSGDSKNVNLIFDISKSFPKDLEKIYVNQVKYASKLYGTFFTNNEKINIYLYTEKDAKKIAMHPVLSKDAESLQTWFSQWERGQGREHNLGLAAWYTKHQNIWQGYAGLVVHSGANSKSLRPYSIQVMPHEYFHVVQDYYLNKERKYSWSSYAEYALMSPPTFREGSANTISFALASNNKTQYFELYRNFIAEKKLQSEVKFFKKLTTQKDVVQSLKLMESNNNRADVHEASYAIGQLLYEWVIAEYGFKGYRKIVENQIKVKNFAENIKLSLGISTDQLYKAAAGHIISAFQFGF